MKLYIEVVCVSNNILKMESCVYISIYLGVY
jgi:hypothetical protein